MMGSVVWIERWHGLGLVVETYPWLAHLKYYVVS